MIADLYMVALRLVACMALFMVPLTAAKDREVSVVAKRTIEVLACIVLVLICLIPFNQFFETLSMVVGVPVWLACLFVSLLSSDKEGLKRKELSRLAYLKSTGVLTETAFQNKKNQILSEIGNDKMNVR